MRVPKFPKDGITDSRLKGQELDADRFSIPARRGTMPAEYGFYDNDER